MRSIVKKLKQQVQESTKKSTEKDTQIAQLSKAKDAASSLASKSMEDLRKKVAAVEKDNRSVRTELNRAQTRNARLLDKLREFQNQIRVLKLAK